MAFEFWGKSSDITTVTSTPTPTNITFSLFDATNLIPNQWVNIKVAGTFERTKITNKNSNVITVNPALSAPPDVPGEVRSGRELIRNHLLNNGYLGNASLEDLMTADMQMAPNGIKAFVPEHGIYRWIYNDSSPADSEFIIENENGRFFLENSQDKSTNTEEELFFLKNKIEALETKTNDLIKSLNVIYNTVEEMPDISAQANSTTRFILPLKKAKGFTAEIGDIVIISLSDTQSYNLAFYSTVLKKNVLSIGAVNPSSSNISIASQKVFVFIIKKGSDLQ